MPHDLTSLGNIDVNFDYTGTSAVDTAVGMLRGRPYGGVALLWNKSVFRDVTVINCGNPRICAIKVSIDQRSFLVCCVYMPTDKPDNLMDFTDCLSAVSAIVDSNNTESVYVLGDFNAHPGEVFFHELGCFCDDQEWICADVNILGIQSGTYTFVSDAHGSARWLDHCLATKSAMDSIANVYVNYSVLWSDHFPLVIECNLQVIKPKVIAENKTPLSNIVWGVRKPEQVEKYINECETRFKLIDFPDELRQCCDQKCSESMHTKVIDKLYCDIISALTESSIVSKGICSFRKKKPIPGWNKHVSEAHGTARLKFEAWVWYGQPRSGLVFEEMLESKRVFGSRLKWCQKNVEQIKLDIIAKHHSKRNFGSFWKSVNAVNTRAGFPVSFEGVSDRKCIAEMFKNHFSVKARLGPTQSKEVLCPEPSGQEIRTKFFCQRCEQSYQMYVKR